MTSKNKLIIQYIFFTVLILYLQGFVLNSITPIHRQVNVYIYFLPLLFFPIKTSKTFILLISILLGFYMDIMMDTLGLFMMASLWVGFYRVSYLQLVFSSKKIQIVREQNIGLSILPFSIFILYIVMICSLHNFMVVMLESFTWSINYYLLIKWLLDTLYSSLFFLLFYLLYYRSIK